MSQLPRKSGWLSRRRLTVLGMMTVIATVALSLGFWKWLRQCEDEQTIAWKGWIVDLSSKSDAARDRASHARVVGKDAEAAAWKMRAEWFDGRLQRARASLAAAEVVCRSRGVR